MKLAAITEYLGEESSDPFILGVNFNDEPEIQVGHLQNGGGGGDLGQTGQDTQTDSVSGNQEVRACNGAVIWLMFWMKHAAHLTHTFLFGLEENLNVVKVHEHKDLQRVTVDIIDQRLEDSSGVGDTEWNHQVFIVAVRLPPRSRQYDRR